MGAAAAKRHVLVGFGWAAIVLLLGSGVFVAWPVIIAKPVSGAGRAAGAAPGPKEWFNRQYALADGESVRFVSPPFLPDRQRLLFRAWASPPSGPASQRQGMLWFYYPPLQQWGMSTGTSTVGDAVIDAGVVTQAQVQAPPELMDTPFHGDWVVRDKATPDERLHQLERILRVRLKRDIHIDKRQVKTEAIVARGSWSPRPLPGEKDTRDVFLFVDGRDTTTGAGGGTDNPAGFFKRIEDITRRRVLDRTQSKPREVSWRNDYSLRDVESDPQRLRTLLDNVSRQTSLAFTLEPYDAWVYVVSEGNQKTE